MINRQNEFLVIATRALWNVLTPKEVFKYIKCHQHLGMGFVTKNLAQKVKEIYSLEGNMMPDITIIVQYLNSSIVSYKGM